MTEEITQLGTIVVSPPVTNSALAATHGLPADTVFEAYPDGSGSISYGRPDADDWSGEVYDERLVGTDEDGEQLSLEERLKKKEEEEKRKRPAPTAASPAPPEGIPDNSDAIAVCTAPDVCKTPVGSSVVPIPYQVYGLAGDDGNYSPDIFFNGVAAKKFDSVITTTIGDAPGSAKGVKSGTVESIVEPTGHSTVLRLNGQWAIRHRDSCTLNSGNCPGEYIFVRDTAAYKPPDGGNQSEKGEKKGDSRSSGQRFAEGFTQNASETWDGLKTVASHGWEGTKNVASSLLNDPAGTMAAGASNAWSTAAGAATWTGHVAGNLWTDPSATLGRGRDNVLNTGSNIWHGIADPYAQAYAEGGMAQALGHGTFDVAKLALEALATKGAATAAGKAGSTLAGATKLGQKAEDAVEAAKDAHKLEGKTESGNDGVRVTKAKRWKEKQVNGRRVYQRDDLIDPNKRGADGRTNSQRMQDGDAPIGPDGNSINLHHMTQDEPGSIAEVDQTFHKDNHKILHMYPNGQAKIGYGSAPGPIDRRAFKTWSRNYWKIRAGDF